MRSFVKARCYTKVQSFDFQLIFHTGSKVADRLSREQRTFSLMKWKRARIYVKWNKEDEKEINVGVHTQEFSKTFILVHNTVHTLLYIRSFEEIIPQF